MTEKVYECKKELVLPRLDDDRDNFELGETMTDKLINKIATINLNDSERYYILRASKSQIPQNPITYKGTNRADCPVCDATVRGIKAPFGDWCSKCGQKLDWKVN